MEHVHTYTAFEAKQLFCRGDLSEVIVKIKRRISKTENDPSILIFSDATGKVMDFNFQGSEKDVLKRVEVFVTEPTPQETSGPGRPKLGVMSREISLLPRHWEWLATQNGGASATLRRLVEEARKKSHGSNDSRQAQERAHKFMSAMTGDLEGYEEALRALYKKDEKAFRTRISGWSRDIRNHVIELAEAAFK